MRRTKEEAEQTRQDLLDAALTVFSEQGYQAARLQDIASAAGTTRGAIYHHFGSKVGLYQELMAEAQQQAGEVLAEAVAAGGSFTEVCRRILEAVMTTLAQNERFRQVTALSLFKTGVSPELTALEQERIQSAEAAIAGIADYMQMGIESGAVRTDLSPMTMARALIAFQNGVAWLWLANGEFFPLAEDAADLADVLLNGILRRE